MIPLTEIEAKGLAEAIIGLVNMGNGFEGESGSLVERHTENIAKKAKVFFDANPALRESETTILQALDEVCNGESGATYDKYKDMVGYSDLDVAIDEYFDDMC